MAYSLISLDRVAQTYADAAIDLLADSRVLSDDPVLEPLYAWLGVEGRLINVVCSMNNWIHVPSPFEIVEKAREQFVGDEKPDAYAAFIRALAKKALDGDAVYWGDEYIVPIAATLRHSDGRERILGLTLEHYLEGPYRWHGLFRDEQSYLAELGLDGLLHESQALETASDTYLLDLWNSFDS